MENNYYTPDREDLCSGYQCEIEGNRGWYKEEISTLVDHGFGSDIGDAACELHYGKLRTKYLDREDIESLGWKYKATYGDSVEFEINDVWKMGGGFLKLNISSRKVKIITVDPGFNSDGPNHSTKFHGNCPSINELRKIMKLINIK